MSLPPHAFCLNSGSDGVSLSALGLLTALERLGKKTLYFKPFSHAPQEDLKLLAFLNIPHVPFCQEIQASTSPEKDALSEALTALTRSEVACEVLVLEGLDALAQELSRRFISTLRAKEILVSSPPQPLLSPELKEEEAFLTLRFKDVQETLGVIPWSKALHAPSAQALAAELGGRRRSLKGGSRATESPLNVSRIQLALGGTESVLSGLEPGVFLLVSGDRSDLFSALAHEENPTAKPSGILLVSPPQPSCEEALTRLAARGVPIFETKLKIQEWLPRIGRLSPLVVDGEDSARAKRAIEHAARSLQAPQLKAVLAEPQGRADFPSTLFEHEIFTRARASKKRIVLPESEDERVLEAAIAAHAQGLAECMLLGKRLEVERLCKTRGLTLPEDLQVVDPEPLSARFLSPLLTLRKDKGLTEEAARSALQHGAYLGVMMMHEGEVDGMVSGALYTTAETLKPAFQILKTKPGMKLVSSVFFMCLESGVLVFGDCAVNPNPSASELSEIAIQSALTARAFGLDPKVALISYATKDSGAGPSVELVKEAVMLAQKERPDIPIDGPLQYDAAFVPEVGRKKAPGSPVAGRANVFVFPDLNTGNTTYKAVQRSTDALCIGPVLQGLSAPVNDLSRGASVQDIIYTIALTAIQAGVKG